MYQATFEECFGSEWSGPICPYMLTHHRATITAFVTVLSNGYQTCRTNMTALTSRMKVQRTEMATLKSVILIQPLVFIHFQILNSQWNIFQNTEREKTYVFDQINGVLGIGL